MSLELAGRTAASNLHGSALEAFVCLALIVAGAGLPIVLVAFGRSEPRSRWVWVSIVVALFGLVAGLVGMSVVNPTYGQLPEWVWMAATGVGLLVPLCSFAWNWRSGSHRSEAIWWTILVVIVVMLSVGLVLSGGLGQQRVIDDSGFGL